MDEIAGTHKYNSYVAKCAAQHVQVASKPADVFARITSDQIGWQFSDNAISSTLAADDTLASLAVPDATLCAGLIQEVVRDQLNPSADTPLLAAPDAPGPWTDQVEIAVGNTTVQAVSALVKSHFAAPGGAPVLSSYETLLDALQLGLPRDLEGQGNSLITLEQALHANVFSQIDGGHQRTTQTKAAPGSQASIELTLPLTLAESSYLTSHPAPTWSAPTRLGPSWRPHRPGSSAPSSTPARHRAAARRLAWPLGRPQVRVICPAGRSALRLLPCATSTTTRSAGTSRPSWRVRR